MNIRVGLGYDVHPFANEATGRRLVLGGVHIDHVGLDGHSDADAVAHAVSDALLGPAGLGDLGTMFPSSDDRYRGADSMQLLEQVAIAVHAAGWRVGNVDVVISAEQPRLAPHTDAMAGNLRRALQLLNVSGDDDGVFVSVRPKRGEGVGAIGRGDGIAVRAVALLVRANP